MYQEDPEIEQFSILLLRVKGAIFWILQVYQIVFVTTIQS